MRSKTTFRMFGRNGYEKDHIFDLDGLLIDSEIISYNLYADLLRNTNSAFRWNGSTRQTAAKTK